MVSPCQQQDKGFCKVKLCKPVRAWGVNPGSKHVQWCWRQWFILLQHLAACQILPIFCLYESCLPLHSATITTTTLRAVGYLCISLTRLTQKGGGRLCKSFPKVKGEGSRTVGFLLIKQAHTARLLHCRVLVYMVPAGRNEAVFPGIIVPPP